MEESRVTVVSIIVKDEEASEAVNKLLHEYRQYIVGRSGDPLPPEADVDHQRGDGCAGRGDKRTFREAGHAAGVTAKTLTAKV